MITIKEMVNNYISSGMTLNQAESSACQKIIISKISKSKLADNVLLKGGVVMFNLTKNIRRTTADLDFDFIRYDISDVSLNLFFEMLNNVDAQYTLKILSIRDLNQDDYQGKRVITSVSDKTRIIKFKLDIGVHTLMAIEQNTTCFSFDGEKLFLKVNPIEQIFSEKLYSLAKHGALSTRYKDVFDMYYLIKNEKMDKKLVKKCLELLTIKKLFNLNTIEDVIERVDDTLEDKQFANYVVNAKEKWIDADYTFVKESILDYINSI